MAPPFAALAWSLVRYRSAFNGVGHAITCRVVPGVDILKERDVLLLALVIKLEVIFVEALHHFSVLIEHLGVELDQLGSDSNHLVIGRCSRFILGIGNKRDEQRHRERNRSFLHTTSDWMALRAALK